MVHQFTSGVFLHNKPAWHRLAGSVLFPTVFDAIRTAQGITQFIQVYVSGRAVTPGGVVVPKGSGLNQALKLAGGHKLLRGKVKSATRLVGTSTSRKTQNCRERRSINFECICRNRVLTHNRVSDSEVTQALSKISNLGAIY